jgi:hypothetical protein
MLHYEHERGLLTARFGSRNQEIERICHLASANRLYRKHRTCFLSRQNTSGKYLFSDTLYLRNLFIFVVVLSFIMQMSVGAPVWTRRPYALIPVG